MKINDVDFNREWAKSVTKKEFLDVFMPTDVFKDDPKRPKMLEGAWELLNNITPHAQNQEEN